LYILEYIGINQDNEAEIKYHIRSKGLQKKKAETLTMESFEKMLSGESIKFNDIMNFKRNYSNFEIKTEYNSKILNKKIFIGRNCKNDENHTTYCWTDFDEKKYNKLAIQSRRLK